jgi:calcineurin-like phosphoesterase family protein
VPAITDLVRPLLDQLRYGLGVMAVFFTSDTHFGDHGVLNIRPRPFGSVTEMNEVIITRWNSRVGPGDEIWHLGDFARGLKVAEAILPRLNGRKHLVTGNNDEPAVCALNWSSVQAYTELIVDGVMLVLCHYPFRTWNRIDRGSINLHGHSHGRLKPLTRQFDVGVDAHDFQPISLRELLVSRRVTDSRTQ